MGLFNEAYFVLFIVIMLGLLLGHVRIKGISLDVSAIIFAALFLGHLGYEVPSVFQETGLILFIYSVGIQAGPGFFESFKKQGYQLLSIAIIVVVSGIALTLALAYAFHTPFNLAAGLFNGALTSTPGLAAAVEATGSEEASIGYGIAYLFGTVGVIVLSTIMHRIFNINLKKEEQAYEDELHRDYPVLINKNYVVENPRIFGKSMREMRLRSVTGTNISRVLHNGEAFTPNAETILHEGDIVKAVGTEENLNNMELLVGRHTEKQIPLSKKYVVRRILVSNKDVVNKSLGELGIFASYNATATSIRRSGIDITPNPSSRLRYGDKVMVAASDNTMKKLSDLLGDSRSQLIELDFLPVSIGIILGILLGSITLPLGGANLSLGLTGGVLISALVLSKIGRTGPLLWNVAGESNQLIRKIGLIFFLAAVGTKAGANFIETVSNNGLQLLLFGAIVTLVPMFLAVVYGRYVLKMNFLTLIGGLVGAMTSTPALSALEPLTKSNAPQVAYATVYPFALVLLIIVNQLFAIL
ncbi:MAG: aspartate:alanine exchanger family transporter [Bacteroidota bacterium]